MNLIERINILRKNLSGHERDTLVRAVVSDECSRVLYDAFQAAFTLKLGDFRRARDYCGSYRFSKT